MHVAQHVIYVTMHVAQHVIQHVIYVIARRSGREREDASATVTPSYQKQISTKLHEILVQAR